MTPTPTPKEGPPTLRECQRLLESIKNSPDGVVYGLAHRFLQRLTDAALERDERRNQIIRWIINSIDVADKVKYGTNDHRYALATIRLHRSKLQELDALTTATEDKA